MIKPRIILASSSPRRIEILKEYKINFISKEHKIMNEPEYSGEAEPCEFVKNLALNKAKSIESCYPDDFIIGSDTIVVLDNSMNIYKNFPPDFNSDIDGIFCDKTKNANNKINNDINNGKKNINSCNRNKNKDTCHLSLISLGKPKDFNSAFNMLNMLSDNIHNVYTGIALINKNRQIYEFSYDKTEVKVKNLSDEEICNYINKFKPFDKAGAYGIQDSQGTIESYSGSYKNVEGLCIEKLIPLLKKYNLM
jgi:predicted house-cleaning NTP pyrophosphatase (Maf/HAM1 superfamily)